MSEQGQQGRESDPSAQDMVGMPLSIPLFNTRLVYINTESMTYFFFGLHRTATSRLAVVVFSPTPPRADLSKTLALSTSGSTTCTCAATPCGPASRNSTCRRRPPRLRNVGNGRRSAPLGGVLEGLSRRWWAARRCPFRPFFLSLSLLFFSRGARKSLVHY